MVPLVAYGLMLLSVPTLVAALELGSWAALKFRGETPYPPFYFASQESVAKDYPNHRWYDVLDPHLSHANSVDYLKKHLPDFHVLPGFVAYANPNDKNRLRIFVLGGSTTEPHFRMGPSESDPYSHECWPYFLQKRLDELGIPAVVFNGGVAGYNSNQELLKLVRDVLPMKPDIVLSLDGENDQGFAHANKKHPMIHPYQWRVFSTLAGEPEPFRFLPNTVALVKQATASADEKRLSVTFGPDVSTTPWDQWERNIRLMHAVCAELGVDYLDLRQPVLGVGNHQPTPEDAALLREFAETPNAVKIKYLETLREFYDKTNGVPARAPYCVDLVDVFANKSGMYRDARHQTPAGGDVIAGAVVAELQRRNLLHQ